MNLLEHMRTFVAVARLRSFSAAAKRLNTSAPAVSRAIARLEGHLNAVLLTRTTRQVELTQEGMDFFHRCTQIIQGVDDAVRAVADSKIEPEGHVRVHAPKEIGTRYLIPAIADYRRVYAKVTFDLILEDRMVNLSTEEFDLAVSLTPHSGERLVSKNIGATYNVLCASREYVARHGTPHVPAELLAHQCLIPSEAATEVSDTWTFEGPYGAVNVFIPPSSFQLNASDAIVNAVSAGLGIGCVPSFIARPLLRQGRLIEILPGYRLVSRGIHASYLAVGNDNICVRSWLSYLDTYLPKLLADNIDEERHTPPGSYTQKCPRVSDHRHSCLG